ncbi:MAG TPA: hemolysin family protein [Rhizomicrobium sp.]
MVDSSNPSAPGEKPSLYRRLTQLLRGGPSASIRESIEEAIVESERETPELSDQERKLLANLLNVGGLRVSDVMVPRADIVAVEEATPLTELVARFSEAQHSRLPVYRETLDDPLGFIHVKDIFGLLETLPSGTLRWKDTATAKLRRSILFVPPSMPALDLLRRMQSSHIHLALVIDEYGGTDGLVSIEDIIEEIVGDIADEHDDADVQLRALADGTYVADARTELEDFKSQTGIDLATEASEEDVDTLGGLAVSLLGRVPQRGEIIAHPKGYEFEVLEADPRRVRRLRIRPPAPLSLPGAEPEEY